MPSFFSPGFSSQRCKRGVCPPPALKPPQASVTQVQKALNIIFYGNYKKISFGGKPTILRINGRQEGQLGGILGKPKNF
jgi:hypothetical protein